MYSVWLICLRYVVIVFCNCRPETTFLFGGDDVVGKSYIVADG